MASRLEVLSLHEKQSGDVEEHPLMLAGLRRPSEGCNCPHNTRTSGPGRSSQHRIESEAENVYILITIMLRRLITGGDDCYLLDEAAPGLDCGTPTAG